MWIDKGQQLDGPWLYYIDPRRPPPSGSIEKGCGDSSAAATHPKRLHRVEKVERAAI